MSLPEISLERTNTRAKHPLIGAAFGVLISLTGMTLGNADDFLISSSTLAEIENEYGDYARRRIEHWRNLIGRADELTELEKLYEVNALLNEIRFVNDIDHWGLEDYWATPLQTLATNGGDCEDYSIAKYFTLTAMGVPESRLRITYVKALKQNQAHMVLTYFTSPEAEPLILDNLVTKILPSSQRKDLVPVYSFNGQGLWLAKSRGSGKRVGESTRLSRWQSVLARINSQQLHR